jgi:hypothetical protein
VYYLAQHKLGHGLTLILSSQSHQRSSNVRLSVVKDATVRRARLPSAMAAAGAVHSALLCIPSLVEAITNGHTAAKSAASAAASAHRVILASDHALAAARVHRTERLLMMAHNEQKRVGILLASSTAKLEALGGEHATNVSARCVAKQGAWNSLSESWWEEKRIGLRWRLAAVDDSIESLARRGCKPQGSGDYAACVGAVADLWHAVSSEANQLSKWVEEWREIAGLADNRVIGQAGILVRSP